jgi:hypothetical protein
LRGAPGSYGEMRVLSEVDSHPGATFILQDRVKPNARAAFSAS